MAFFNINKHKSRLPVTISKNSAPAHSGSEDRPSSTARTSSRSSSIVSEDVDIDTHQGKTNSRNELSSELSTKFTPVPPSDTDLNLRISSSANNFEGDEHATSRSNKSTDRSTKSTGRSNKSTTGGRNAAKSTSKIGQGPLAKAMQKRPQANQR